MQSCCAIPWSPQKLYHVMAPHQSHSDYAVRITCTQQQAGFLTEAGWLSLDNLLNYLHYNINFSLTFTSSDPSDEKWIYSYKHMSPFPPTFRVWSRFKDMVHFCPGPSCLWCLWLCGWQLRFPGGRLCHQVNFLLKQTWSPACWCYAHSRWINSCRTSACVRRCARTCVMKIGWTWVICGCCTCFAYCLYPW